MICLHCNEERFERKEALVEQVYKNQLLQVKTPVMVCLQCKAMILVDDMADELIKCTKIAYQEKSLDKIR